MTGTSSQRVQTSEAVTRGVRVFVRARYSPEHSQPDRNQWFFLYTIRITNEAPQAVRLVNRHWIITDANGHVEEVRGPGVVGEQPLLRQGQSFEYTSGCPLPTPFGFMEGEFEFENQEDGNTFWAKVAGFPLRIREQLLN
jgi:ApaG protein